MNSNDEPPAPKPPQPPPFGGIAGLDPGELLARALHTVQPSGGSLAWLPPAPEELAALLPQYQIESLLGHGGMGAVYKGRQAALDRAVAIKLLPAELGGDAQFIARFQREARTLAKLQHPGIVAVHDFGQTSEGHLYFVMEFVDGTDLHRILHAPGGLNPAQTLELISQICDALHYAHGKGVIHRDIKPGNILVTTDSRAKLADFGLARPIVEESTMLTGTHVVMGTAAYMAPEQQEGHADQRADIYALGVMLYEMLCGQRPSGAFDPPSHRVQVDVRLDQVVIKAMQQQPERRYQQVSEMKTDVDRIRTTPQQQRKPAPKPKSKARVAAAVIAVCLVLASAGGFVIWKMANQPTVVDGEIIADITASTAGLPPSADPWRDALADLKFVGPSDQPERTAEGLLLKKGSAGMINGTGRRNGAIRIQAVRVGGNDLVIEVRNGGGKGSYQLGLTRDRDALLRRTGDSNESAAPLAKRFPLPNPIQNGETYSMELRIVGGTLTASVNGVLLGSVEDSTLPDGEFRVSQNVHPSVLVRTLEFLPLPDDRSATAPPSGESTPATATKYAPFVNTLGMKFVPVPITGGPTSGQRVLFSVWETRNQDLATYATATNRADLVAGLGNKTRTDPTAGAHWEEATSFCVWLTEREREAGKLGANERYRLPSDHEWSCTVGIGDREEAAQMPSEKSNKLLDVFPWGSAWQPPAGAGNYAGEEVRAHVGEKEGYLMGIDGFVEGYTDAFKASSPAGSFTANAFGLYDLGGNLSEMCEDWLDGAKRFRVMRGGSWMSRDSRGIGSSHRDGTAPTMRTRTTGFRVVLAPTAP